jgi:hypothetical protein
MWPILNEVQGKMFCVTVQYSVADVLYLPIHVFCSFISHFGIFFRVVGGIMMLMLLAEIIMQPSFPASIYTTDFHVAKSDFDLSYTDFWKF